MVDSETVNINLIIATYLLVIATIVGIGLSLWLTRKSLKHTENQLKEMKESNKILRLDLIGKLKPDLKLADFTKELNKPDPLNPTFSFEIQNLGESSVDKLEVNCTEHYPKKDGAFQMEKFLRNPQNLHQTLKAHSTLLKETRTKQFEYIPTGNDSRIDIIVWTKYEFLDGEKSEIIHVLHFVDWKYESHNAYRKRMLDEIREKISQNKK